MVMIQVVLHCIILVDRGENKGDVVQADQVLHGNRTPGQLGIFVVIGGDADVNNRSGRKWTYPSTGLRATWFPHGRTLDWPWTKTHIPDTYPQTGGVFSGHSSFQREFCMVIHSFRTRWRSLLRHWATSRKVAGSIPDGFTGIFQPLNPSNSAMALG